jgi:hypothetical protein
MDLEDILGFEGGGKYVLGGAALLFMGPAILGTVAGAMRPVAKGAMKLGIAAYGRGKTYAAEAKEGLEDLAAEAKSELEQESKSKSTPASSPAKKKSS